jgi:hypothetical protein
MSAAPQPVHSNRSRTMFITTMVLAVLILIPSMLGFANKLLEFFHVFRDEHEGSFAITPMLNYFLATVGFLCLMGWAVAHGMFRDIERPKEQLLEQEAMLDRLPL